MTQRKGHNAEVDLDINALFDWLSQLPMLIGLLILGASAGIEYIFPPFPGDAITLVGAMLIPLAKWPIGWVFLAVLLGSLMGAAINWRVGRWLVDAQRHTWLHRWLGQPNVERRITTLTERFAKHGSIYICLNRFLPAFRALFFIAAGMANVPFWRVMGFGAISAALWNGALLGVGWLVGFNLQALERLLKQYSVVVWSVLGLFLIGYLLFQWRKRRQASPSSTIES